MIYNQSDFSDGFNFITSDVNISGNGYYYLINARQRFGEIEANAATFQNQTIPAGKKQGAITLGNILIVFIAGAAWYNIDGSNIWNKVPGFAMDPTVKKYYTLAVPASTFNFTRILNVSGNIKDPLQTTNFKVNGTIAGIIVQDGINQPFVIYQELNSGNLLSRVTGNYTSWTLNTSMEYVPIGNQMMFLDQKVYIVSQNNKYIYQSISGRPLDFMVNVDLNGDKLPTEDAGGAISVSFSFDSDDITCIKPINTPDSFIYGTARNTRVITLDFTNTIFGEPTYTQAAELVVGIVNQDSALDILGDYALIDFEGVKSFNAVTQLKWEGRNSVFSLQLSRILKSIKQTRCRSIFYNNFALFALDTVWGFLIAVYDTLLGKWVAFDIIDGISSVREFAIVSTPEFDKLYCITENDELYQLYADPINKEAASIHTRAFSGITSNQYGQTATISYQQQGEYLRMYFRDVFQDTKVIITQYCDGQRSQRLEIPLPHNTGGVGPGPIYPPVIPSEGIRAQCLNVNLSGVSLEAVKVAFVIQWKGSAKLMAIELQVSDNMPLVDRNQAEQYIESATK